MTDVLIRLKSGFGQPAICRGCHRPIVWMDTLTGKRMPMNAHVLPQHSDGEGVDVFHASDAHWASCPERAQFDRKRRA